MLSRTSTKEKSLIKGSSLGNLSSSSTLRRKVPRTIKRFVSLEFATGPLSTTMNTLETVEDQLLHHLLIDVTELSVVPFILCMVVLQKDQLVLERLRQPRILPNHSQDSVLYSIARISLIILSWVNFSKEMLPVVAGSALMSSTESNLRYFPLLLNKCRQFSKPLKRSKKDSSLRVLIFLSSILATVSLR